MSCCRKKTGFPALLGALLSGCFILSMLSGCSGNSPTASTAEDDAPKRHINTAYLRIGLYGSLTGTSSLQGRMAQLGCRLAVDEINENGGINGKPIRLIEYDDHADAQSSIEAVKRLILEDQVDAIIGTHVSDNLIQTIPITEQHRILQIGLGTSQLWTGQGYESVFRSTGNSRIYDKAILSEIYSDNRHRLAVCYTDSVYASAGAEHIRELVEADQRIQLVWFQMTAPDQTDFKKYFQQMKLQKPDAVLLYCAANNQQSAGIELKQLRKICGYSGAVYAMEAFADPAARIPAGDSINGLKFVCDAFIPGSPNDADTACEKLFLENFVRAYGSMPEAEEAYRGYDAVMLLAETFRTAKDYSPESLREAMCSIRDHEGIAGTFDFRDGTGDGRSSCKIIQVMDQSTFATKDYQARD